MYTSVIIFGVLIGFIATVLGSLIIFVFKKEINHKINSIILGFSSGIMLASSVFSLIIPSIEQVEEHNILKVLPCVLGMILGSAFLIFLDKIIINLKGEINKNSNATISEKSKRFILAVILHNIPEGLAVGLMFGNAIVLNSQDFYMSALTFSIGIAIQNIPEGSAVSLPVLIELKNKKTSFFYGALSGVVEPISAVLGILLATIMKNVMPYLLGFAGGTMIFVIVDNMLPEAKIKGFYGSIGFMIGFIVMMILDVLL